MQIGQPSRTAMGAAAHRAVHQTLEGGVIFADPFALQILSDNARAGLPDMANDPAHRPMRLFIAARSRFSERTRHKPSVVEFFAARRTCVGCDGRWTYVASNFGRQIL